MLFRALQKVFLKDEPIVGRFGGPELFVRPRAKMPPAAVARSVANDGGQHGVRIHLGIDSPRLGQVEHRAEPLLNGVHGILRGQPFTSRERGQRATLRAHDLRQTLEDILLRFNAHDVSRRQGVHPPGDYTLSSV